MSQDEEIKQLLITGRTNAEICKATGLSLPAVHLAKRRLGFTKSKKPTTPPPAAVPHIRLAGYLGRASEALCNLYQVRHEATELRKEVAHLLARCGLSTRQIGHALAEAKAENERRHGIPPPWRSCSHVTIATWLKEECPAADA